MSRIFEALQRTEGDLAEVALPVIDGSSGPWDSAQEAVEAQDMPSPADILSVVEYNPPVANMPSELAIQPGDDILTGGGSGSDPSSLQPTGTGVRTVSIHLASGAPVLPFDRRSPAAEQYRVIRTKLIQNPKRPRVVAISSAGASDGKSVTALNLAGALALKNGAPVLLLDGDFRRSSIAALLGIPAGPGLANLLAGEAEREDVIVRLQEFPNFHIIPAGSSSHNPAELLDSAAWPVLCAFLRERFEFIVVDAPPIASVADYDLIQNVSDGVIVVVRPDHTSRRACLNTLNIVPKDKRLGVVLNCVGKLFLRKQRHYYDYYSDDAE